MGIVLTIVLPMDVKAEQADKGNESTETVGIEGFQYYLIDDHLIIKWTDENCGDVDVEVINTDTKQVISHGTVKTKATIVEIEPDVEEVAIKANSTNPKESGEEVEEYVFAIPKRPDVEILFEELPVDDDGIPISNKEEITYTVVANDVCGLHVFKEPNVGYDVKDIEAGERRELVAGIDEGDNIFIFYVVDAEGNMFSVPYRVNRDTTVPIVRFARDYNDICTALESVEIEGNVEDCASLTCDGREVEMGDNNRFNYTYELKEGTNEIKFVVTDFAGNAGTYTFTITRVIEKDKSRVIKLIAGVILVILVTGYFWLLWRQKSNKPQKLLLRDVMGLVAPVAAIFILLKVVFCVGTVMSGSMEPALMTGDTVIDNRLAYICGKEIQRGDIIAFYSKEYDEVLGKRIIGLPGDSIEFKDGHVIINGEYLDESAYLSPDVMTYCEKKFIVPEGCYFLLGDNRKYSNDSRYWYNPYISKEDIIGKYIGDIPFSIERDILHIL